MSSIQRNDLASHQMAWSTLRAAAKRAQALSLNRRLQDHGRIARWRRNAAGLRVDLARHHLDDTILADLIALAKSQALPELIRDLFRGGLVNNTEQRPAIHPQLRRHPPSPAIGSALDLMSKWVDQLQHGTWTGFTGKPITDVVNIGIGGSDLGPRMVTAALRAYAQPPIRTHFVANIDPADLAGTLSSLDAETTLFLVASKSYSTQETRVNAMAARRWLEGAGASGTGVQRHFIAITANPERARQEGVPAGQILSFDEGVGGRYSLWSTIGFAVACGIGMSAFTQLLAGARAMDDHFASAPLDDNLPFLLGALDIWYTAFWNVGSIAVLPYSHDLGLLPSYLQQLTMESNGKRVTRSGLPVDYPTGPVFWGEAGTRGQHSFHQLLHQGTATIPCDFILPLSSNEDPAQHRLLVANCLAQAQILATGRDESAIFAELTAAGLAPAEAQRLAPHKVMPGNRPSTLISFPALTPAALGALLALYEHRVFVSAALWGINPFDQWGVELGKKISDGIAPALATDDNGSHAVDDPLTALLVADYLNAQHLDRP